MNAFAKFLGGILRVLKTPLKLWSQQQKLTAVIAGLGTTAVVMHSNQPAPVETTPPTTTEVVETTTVPPTTTEPTTEATTEPTTVPTEPEPVITDKVLELQELNTYRFCINRCY